MLLLAVSHRAKIFHPSLRCKESRSVQVRILVVSLLFLLPFCPQLLKTHALHGPFGHQLRSRGTSMTKNAWNYDYNFAAKSPMARTRGMATWKNCTGNLTTAANSMRAGWRVAGTLTESALVAVGRNDSWCWVAAQSKAAWSASCAVAGRLSRWCLPVLFSEQALENARSFLNLPASSTFPAAQVCVRSLTLIVVPQEALRTSLLETCASPTPPRK